MCQYRQFTRQIWGAWCNGSTVAALAKDPGSNPNRSIFVTYQILVASQDLNVPIVALVPKGSLQVREGVLYGPV